MQMDNATVSVLFLGLQIGGMIGFYIYYTYKNKKAQKDYWQRASQEM